MDWEENFEKNIKHHLENHNWKNWSEEEIKNNLPLHEGSIVVYWARQENSKYAKIIRGKVKKITAITHTDAPLLCNGNKINTRTPNGKSGYIPFASVEYKDERGEKKIEKFQYMYNDNFEPYNGFLISLEDNSNTVFFCK